jgi:hypothetical protein
MIKSQFIIIGVLSLIAVVATTSTLSAYAQLKGSDVLSLVRDAADGKAVDVQGVKDKALSVFDNKAVQDFADKTSNVDLEKVLNPQSSIPSTNIPALSELGSSLGSDLPVKLPNLGSDLPVSIPSTTSNTR